MSDKKLLIATYYWPPSGGPAVQRWLSLTAELSKLGWKIWLLTVDEKYATYQAEDHTLVERVHPNITVIKTKTIEPFGFYKLLFGKKSIPAPGFSNESNPSMLKRISRFIRGNLFIPDPRKYWRSFGEKAAEKIIRENGISLIITAGPPHSTHFIGKSLKKKLNIHWICDFHDLWTDVIYYDLLYHLPVVKKIDQRLEADILTSCNRIITVGEKYQHKLLSKSQSLSPAKFHIARIGYDDHINEVKPTSPSNTFIISYIGSIADYYQPEIFIRCYAKLIRDFPTLKFLLRFVGTISPAILHLFKESKVEDYIELTGYVQHAKAVEYLKQSTVLLLINPVTKDESMVIPGKVYEYLAARKPIINITKLNSETAQLISECNAGKTFERTQDEELYAFLKTLVTNWQQNGKVDHQADEEKIKTFSRSQIAAEMSEMLLKEIKASTRTYSNPPASDQ